MMDFVIVVRMQTCLPDVYAKLRLDDANLWTKSSENMPTEISQTLSPFQQVLVVQALYPDKLIDALVNFLSHSLGKIKYSGVPYLFNWSVRNHWITEYHQSVIDMCTC